MFQKAIANYLIETATITFYRRYVDDTLVLIKPNNNNNNNNNGLYFEKSLDTAHVCLYMIITY